VDRRKYAEGPLTAEDFLATADKTATRLANTVTELRHEYRYRYRLEGQHVVAQIESIAFYAYVRRDLSWNKQVNNQSLLDHEQGHLDLAHIESLKARQHFHKTRATAHLQGKAATQKDAVAALDRLINQQAEPFIQAMRDADVAYDRATSHGLNAKQAEHRRVQQETIKRLEAEWALLAPTNERTR
jgi:hypothetical protein